jgi:ribosomal protein S1
MHNYIDHIQEHKENIRKDWLENKKLLTGFAFRLDKQDHIHVALEHGYVGIISPDNAIADNVSFQERKRKLITLIGLPIKAYVEGDDEGTIILNRKRYIKETREKIVNQLQIGDEILGYVRAVKPYGVFVDIGGDLVGLLHQSKIKHNLPTTFTHVGDLLKVKVISFEQQNLKLEFSLEDIEDPWIKYGSKIKQNEYLMGTVLNHIDGIQFIELYPGVEAILNVTDNNYITEGNKVRVRIVKSDYKNKRIRVELCD